VLLLYGAAPCAIVWCSYCFMLELMIHRIAAMISSFVQLWRELWENDIVSQIGRATGHTVWLMEQNLFSPCAIIVWCSSLCYCMVQLCWILQWKGWKGEGKLWIQDKCSNQRWAIWVSALWHTSNVRPTATYLIASSITLGCTQKEEGNEAMIKALKCPLCQVIFGKVLGCGLHWRRCRASVADPSKIIMRDPVIVSQSEVSYDQHCIKSYLQSK
jgi:hypothetical protein